VVIAAATVAVPVVALACLAAGYHDATLALGVSLFPAGMLAIAVGPQHWIVGALPVLSTTLERTKVAAVLLAVIAALLVLTVPTLTWFRAAGAVIALVVFAVAAASAHLARSRPDLT